MNLKNKLLILFSFLYVFIPVNVLAYSSYVIPGGETVGIEVSSKGVLVVGFYKIDNEFVGKNAGFQVGDKILKVNNTPVETIDEMITVVDNKKEDSTKFTILRDDKEMELDVDLKKNSEGVYKTGLYIKDSIVGIGTLTYIDPESKKFGALGHEIIEKTTAEKFEIKDGKIFESNVTNIDKSSNNSAGEKNATYDKGKVFGTIEENESSGVFGNYKDNLPNKEKLKVATPKEIKPGEATIQTVLKDNTVESFKINILRLDDSNNTKNILFEITDTRLLEEAGGIVQGMSGSPIVQDNKIVGAVTHVIVNDVTKGYGIFITTMLEEGEN